MKWDLLTFFLVLWDVVFLTSPISALITRSKFPGWRTSGKRVFITLNLALIAMAVSLLATKWSFTGLIADAIALGAGYFAYTSLLFLVSLRRPRWLTWSAVGVGLIPTAAGILLGVTIVPVLFILGDIVPQKEAWLSRNYSYRISYYGGALADHDGAELTILHHPTYLPFLENEILKKQYDDSSCDYQKLNLSLTGDQVRISCPKTTSTGVETTVVSRN